MSWNIQQPIVAETAAAKANKGGDDLTNPATWRTNLDVPTNLEARRRGLPNVSGVVFDGATASTRITAPCQDVGTGDFSMWVRVRVPTSAPSQSFVYSAVSQGVSSAFSSGGSFLVTQEANGSIAVSGYVATVFTQAFSVSGFIAAYGGQIVDIVLTRATVSGTSTLTLYVNGIAVGSSTAAVAGTSAGSLYFHAGAYAGGPPSHTVHRAAFYNRALSLSDVAELIVNGVHPADQWARTTPVWSSDFSSGVDSFLGLGGANSTLAGNIDGIGGQNDNLRTTTGTFTGNIAGPYRAGLARGKRHRITFSYYIPSTNATLRGVRVGWFNNADNYGPASTTLDAWTTVSEISPIDTFQAGSNTNVGLYATNAGGSNVFNGTSGDVLYVRNVILERVGAVVNLDLAVGIGLFFPDMSTNLLHADGNGGITHTMPREYGQMTVVRDLAHSAISSTLGTTKLFDLPPNCGIVHVEFDRTAAFDAGVTLEVGTAANGTKFAAATAASATGIIGAASASSTSESNSANTPIYVRKSGATTVGQAKVRVTYSIRG